MAAVFQSRRTFAVNAILRRELAERLGFLQQLQHDLSSHGGSVNFFHLAILPNPGVWTVQILGSTILSYSIIGLAVLIIGQIYSYTPWRLDPLAFLLRLCSFWHCPAAGWVCIRTPTRTLGAFECLCGGSSAYRSEQYAVPAFIAVNL